MPSVSVPLPLHRLQAPPLYHMEEHDVNVSGSTYPFDVFRPRRGWSAIARG